MANQQNSNNPIAKKEVDFLDPEGHSQKQQNKSLKQKADDFKKNAERFKKILSALKTVITALFSWPIVIVTVILLVIFLVYCFIQGLNTMPGLMQAKLKSFVKDLVNSVEGWFTTGAAADLEDDYSDIINVANYLEEMGYDLVGYGFVTPSLKTESLKTFSELIEDSDNYTYEKESGSEIGHFYEKGSTSPADIDYYNALGQLVNNKTGQVIEYADKYIDKYGILRSMDSDETNNNGEGKLVDGSVTFLNLKNYSLIRTYLLSDYRIYTLRNDDSTTLNNIYASIQKLFGGYKDAWSKGLINIYIASNGIANEFWKDSLGTVVLGESVKIDRTSLTLKNGWFNNSTSYKIEGWAPRYGLSLEFLLSLHIGTMAPDLVYAILQNFDTEIQVYLNESSGVVNSKYVEVAGTGDVTLNDMKDALTDAGYTVTGDLVNDTALLSWVNNLVLTKKKCEAILKGTALQSPDNCLGSAQEYVLLDSTSEEELFSDTSPLDDYGIEESELDDLEEDFGQYSVTTSDGANLENFTAKKCAESIGVSDTSYKNDNFTLLADSASNYGYDGSSAEISKEEYDTEKSVNYVDMGLTTVEGETFRVEKVKLSRYWEIDVDDEDVEVEWVTYKFLVYKTGSWTQYKYTDGSESDRNTTLLDEEEWVDTIVWEYIIREKSYQELKDAGVIDEDGNVVDTAGRCSENQVNKCCSVCKKYVKAVANALAEVSDQDYKNFTPYIARVVGSWFRDTYFIVPDSPDLAINDYFQSDYTNHKDLFKKESAYGDTVSFVKVDEEYLADTGEYWTSYEMKDGTDEYQLYYLNSDGTTSNTTLEMFLNNEVAVGDTIADHESFSSQQAAEDAGYAFVKKAELNSISNVISESETTNNPDNALDSRVLWSVYNFSSDTSTSAYIRVAYGEDEGGYVDDLYEMLWGEDLEDEDTSAGIFYNTEMANSITQEEDAQRGETNPLIKYLFKYRKYYIYDGTTENAILIEKDKDNIINILIGDDTNYEKTDAQETLSSLSTYYGSNWKTEVREKLATYGRSALRQAYNPYFAFVEPDDEELAEQWLEWQLDMYYMDKFNVDIKQYYGTTEDLLKLESDPRNPDLISVVNITKSSLNAFSILENTGTIDAEYQFRDFKELIVELNYFDKEDLSEKPASVFTWILPETSASGWPVRPYDKQDVEYGALIQSHDTYEALGVIFDSESGNGGADSWQGTKYQLTDEQIWMIAHICELENDGVDGVRFQCSFLVNLFELYSLRYGTSQYGTGASGLIAFLEDTSGSGNRNGQYILQVKNGHFTYNCSDNSVTSEEIEAVKDTLVNGNRTIPQYVNEHDLLPNDIASATNNGTSIDVSDRTQYKKDVTVINNIYSSTWTFYAFCKEGGDPYGYTDWAYELVTGSSSTSSNTQTSSSSDNTTTGSIDESKIMFVGDSWIAGLSGTSDAKTTYFDGRVGATAQDFINNMPTVPEDASCIVLALGLNCTSDADGMNSLIDKLVLANSGKQIYVLQTPHVGSGYSYGSITAASFNTSIDNFNSKVKEHCASTSNVTYIDPTTEIVGSDGYLKSEYKSNTGTNDGEFHLSTEGYSVWYNSIISLINGNSSDGVVSTFEGYEADQLVSSPVTGKVIEYGTHTRMNIYSGKYEEVGYIVIEALSEGADDSGNGTGTGYFTDSMVSSATYESETNYSAAEALNLFYKEYDGNCAGYTIMIDGFNVDLTTTDEDGNEGFYEQNEVVALYNSETQKERENMEQAKEDAPFFIDNAGGEGLPSMEEGYQSLSGYTGFYVKEGKYIGKTTIPSAISTSTEETPESIVSDYEEGTAADYIRIVMKDLDYSIVDDIEDFFDIPDADDGNSNSGIYGDLEQTTNDASTAEKIRAAMTYFISQGFSQEGAAGILGNLIVESSLDASVVSSSGYYGLAQWNTSDGGGHWWDGSDGIKNWLISNGYNEDSFAGQIRAIFEADRRGQMTDSLWAELQNMTDVEKAAELFCVYYEACPGSLGNYAATQWYLSGTNYQGLADRKKYAQQALEVYTGARDDIDF